GRAAHVLDEAILVEVPEAIDPIKGCVSRWQQPLHQGGIGSPVVRFAQKDQKQWSGIERSVIRPKRKFLAPGHFTLTKLMEELARSIVPPWVVLLSLVASEHLERIDGELWTQCESLIRGDDGVASKHRSKPRNPCGDYALAVIGNLQSVEVADRAAHRCIKNAVIAAEPGRGVLPFGKPLPPLTQGGPELARCGLLFLLSNNGIDDDLYLPVFHGRELDIPNRSLLLHSVGSWLHLNPGLAE